MYTLTCGLKPCKRNLTMNNVTLRSVFWRRVKLLWIINLRRRIKGDWRRFQMNNLIDYLIGNFSPMLNHDVPRYLCRCIAFKIKFTAWLEESYVGWRKHFEKPLHARRNFTFNYLTVVWNFENNQKLIHLSTKCLHARGSFSSIKSTK